jgi:hypothetical protein
MSQPQKPKWKWNYPKPPYGSRWPKLGEVMIPQVTRNELLKYGIPYGSGISFPSRHHLNNLPQTVNEGDRPLTQPQFDEIMIEARMEWAMLGMPDGPPRPRDLNSRQIAFARAIASGATPIEAQEMADFPCHRGNAHRLLRDERVREEILACLGLVGVQD